MVGSINFLPEKEYGRWCFSLFWPLSVVVKGKKLKEFSILSKHRALSEILAFAALKTVAIKAFIRVSCFP
jgi:hypothetical protein